MNWLMPYGAPGPVKPTSTPCGYCGTPVPINKGSRKSGPRYCCDEHRWRAAAIRRKSKPADGYTPQCPCGCGEFKTSRSDQVYKTRQCYWKMYKRQQRKDANARP